MSPQEIESVTVRSVRRALMASLLSIVACAIMLFGTTFAWFTANQTSGVNTMTAANFDVSITDVTSDDGATHTVTLARLGGGTAPGYCEFKLNYAGEYTVTSGTITTTVDENGAQTGDTSNETTSTLEHYSGAKDFYVEFADGTNNQSVTFRFSTQNVSTVSFDKTKVSWGEYPNPTTNEATPVKLMARRTFSVTPQPTVTQITDGDVLDTIGHEDVEDIKIETITIEKPAAGQAEENKNDEDGLKDGAKVNAGSGKGNENNESNGIDSNGGTDSGSNSGSGSGSGGSGSGAGGGESESGAGGSGAGESAGGSGESSGTDSSSGGTDAGSGNSGTGTESSSGDSGSTGGTDSGSAG